MSTPVSRLLVLAALVAVLAGCGSKGGSSPGTANEPTGGGGVNGISVGNCLNEDENFLVQPSSNALDGQSPGGVTFTLTFYKDGAAARRRRRQEEREVHGSRRERRRRLPRQPDDLRGRAAGEDLAGRAGGDPALHRQGEVGLDFSCPRRGEVPNRVRSGRKQP